MGLFDNAGTSLLNLTPKLLSPEANFDYDYSDQRSYQFSDSSKKSWTYAPVTSTQTTSTYAPQYAPVDARSVILTINSPNATTKKEDSLSGSSQNTGIAPIQSPKISLPLDFGTTSTDQNSSPSVGGAIGWNWTTFAIIGLVGAGAYLIFIKK